MGLRLDEDGAPIHCYEIAIQKVAVVGPRLAVMAKVSAGLLLPGMILHNSEALSRNSSRASSANRINWLPRPR
jgi:hypothetical protein